MGPYQYKVVEIKLNTTGRDTAEIIQNNLNKYSREGWELFKHHHLPSALMGRPDMMIFRKPSENMETANK